MQVVSLNNNKINSDRENNQHIVFSNSVGVLFLENLLLPKYNSRIPIDLVSIKKIKLIKKDNLVFNIFCLVTGIVSFLILFIYSTTYLETALLATIGLGFLLGAFKMNKSKYVLVITKSNLDFIELNIDRKHKDEAKKLVREIEKKSMNYTRDMKPQINNH